MNHRLVITLVALMIAVGAAASPTAIARPSLDPTFMTSFDPQGGFEVEVLVDGSWQRVGTLSFDRYVRDRELTLPAAAIAAPQVWVRLVQYGGGAAHVDRVVLGQAPPTRIAGTEESDALALVARRDNDVLDAFAKTIELTFPGGLQESPLRIAARVEPRANEGLPFAFPPANQYDPAAPVAFYHYRPRAAGQAPASPDGLDATNPLFAELSRPTTGHPDGVTYGWVTNDRDTLYAEVEFTSDNTRDGDKDWSSLTIRRDGMTKEFRVAENETRWGSPSFVRTDRAGYRHKLYAFAIPLAEVGAKSAQDAGDLELAFAAYGTAAVTWLSPTSHYFGEVLVGTTSPPTHVTITNVYGSDLTLGTPYYTRGGGNAGQFPFTNETCSDGLVLSPGSSCGFDVSFAPTTTGRVGDVVPFTVLTAPGAPLTQDLVVEGDGIVAVPAVPTLTPAGVGLAVLALFGLGYFILRRS